MCISDVVFFKQETAYEVRISDWSLDVCVSDLVVEDDVGAEPMTAGVVGLEEAIDHRQAIGLLVGEAGADELARTPVRRRLAIFDEIGSASCRVCVFLYV